MDDTLQVFLEKLANIGEDNDARETVRPMGMDRSPVTLQRVIGVVLVTAGVVVFRL